MTSPASAPPLSGGRFDVRRGLAILWLSLFTMALVRTAWVGDDAYFTFRTIDNFVHGYGLRWNIDERVQAYTHPLWMMLLTPFYWLTGEPFFTSIAISMVLTLVTVWLILRQAPSRWSAAAGLTALLASRAFIDYSTSGLENPLTNLLLVLFLGRVIADQRVTTQTMVLAGLLLLNRLDLVFLVAPVLIAFFPWRSPRRALRSAAIGFLPLAIWELFSILYYGFAVPNTAFAKVKTGIAEWELLKQGFTYLLDSATRDPLTLLFACGVAVWTIVDNPRRTRPIGIAILLHVAAITYAGGDFMSGRMLAAPLVAAVMVFVRTDAAAWFEWQWIPTAIVLAAGVLGLQALALGQDIADRKDVYGANGVADERGIYFRSNGLIAYARDAAFWPRSKWIESGLAMRKEGPRVVVHCCNGMLGYAAGPTVHIVDTLGLGDPLLSRLPATSDWRVGHYGRAVPRGYPQTLEVGQNSMASPQMATYYSKLSQITRGPIWDRRRLLTILRMNLGSYDSLLDNAAATTPGCLYVLMRTSQQMSASGGDGSLTIEQGVNVPTCAWHVESDTPWLRLRDSPSGNATTTLNFRVDANPTTTPRAGTIAVTWPEGSAMFTVKQDGLPDCRYSVAPEEQRATAVATDYTLIVTPSAPSCSFKVEPTVPWMSIVSGGSNTGPSTVVYRVAANGTHETRAGSLVVSGLPVGKATLAVTQSAQ